MYQHPFGVFGGLQSGQHGVCAFISPVHDGNLRMLRQRELGKAAVAGAYRDDHAGHPGMRQQRKDRVFENGFIADREILLRTFRLHTAAKSGRRHHGANIQ